MRRFFCDNVGWRIGQAAGARWRWLTLCGETREHEFTSPRTALRHHPTIIPPGGSDDFVAGMLVVRRRAHAQLCFAERAGAMQGTLRQLCYFLARGSVLLLAPGARHTGQRPTQNLSKLPTVSQNLPLKEPDSKRHYFFNLAAVSRNLPGGRPRRRWKTREK